MLPASGSRRPRRTRIRPALGARVVTVFQQGGSGPGPIRTTPRGEVGRRPRQLADLLLGEQQRRTAFRIVDDEAIVTAALQDEDEMSGRPGSERPSKRSHTRLPIERPDKDWPVPQLFVDSLPGVIPPDRQVVPEPSIPPTAPGPPMPRSPATRDREGGQATPRAVRSDSGRRERATGQAVQVSRNLQAPETARAVPRKYRGSTIELFAQIRHPIPSRGRNTKRPTPGRWPARQRARRSKPPSKRSTTNPSSIRASRIAGTSNQLKFSGTCLQARHVTFCVDHLNGDDQAHGPGLRSRTGRCPRPRGPGASPGGEAVQQPRHAIVSLCP